MNEESFIAIYCVSDELADFRHGYMRMISFIHLDIDDCAGKLCNGKGQCKDGINDYTCNCINGYTGKDCQTSE